MNKLTSHDWIPAMIFFFLCPLFFNTASAQSKNKQSREINIPDEIKASPFYNYLGNWVTYSRESTFAAYHNVKIMGNGTGFLEQFENKEGIHSAGLIFKDPVNGEWCQAWVGPNSGLLNGNGIRKLLPSDDPNACIFQGETLLNSKVVKDRYSIKWINNETIIKTYELSTDGGNSWDIEYQYTFKKI